ncbi:MAG: hypothetical protein AAB320_01350 [Elusimicrobiota bacterium]
MYQVALLKNELSYPESISIYAWNPRKAECKFVISFGALPAGIEIMLDLRSWNSLVADLNKSAWQCRLVNKRVRVPIVILPKGRVSWRVCDPGKISKAQARNLARSAYGAIYSGAMSLEINRTFYEAFRSACIHAAKLYRQAKHVDAYEGGKKEISHIRHVQLYFAGKPCLFDQGISTAIFSAFRASLTRKPPDQVIPAPKAKVMEARAKNQRGQTSR